MCAKYLCICTAQFLSAKYTFVFVFVFELYGPVRLAWRRVELNYILHTYITFSLKFCMV